MTAVDMVNRPPHYNAYSIEVIEVTRHCSFDIGNAIKYMLRHLHKGTSKQDLEKAQWYIRDHLKHKGDELPLMPPEAQERLRVLVDEYICQDGSIAMVGAAMALLTVDDAYTANTALGSALRSVS